MWHPWVAGMAGWAVLVGLGQSIFFSILGGWVHRWYYILVDNQQRLAFLGDRFCKHYLSDRYAGELFCIATEECMEREKVSLSRAYLLGLPSNHLLRLRIKLIIWIWRAGIQDVASVLYGEKLEDFLSSKRDRKYEDDLGDFKVHYKANLGKVSLYLPNILHICVDRCSLVRR